MILNFEYLQNHFDSTPKVAQIIFGGLCQRN